MSAPYVLERLLADRRITTADIARYLGEMQDEIRAIEERLSCLRSLVSPNASRSRAIAPNTRRIASNTRIASSARIASNNLSNTLAPNASRVKARKRHLSPAVREARRIQGSYVGYLRQIPKTRRAFFQRIAKQRGFPAAVTALRKHLGK